MPIPFNNKKIIRFDETLAVPFDGDVPPLYDPELFLEVTPVDVGPLLTAAFAGVLLLENQSVFNGAKHVQRIRFTVVAVLKCSPIAEHF